MKKGQQIVEEQTAPSEPVKTSSSSSPVKTSSVIDRYKVLQLGSKGEEVKVIQKLLKNFSLGKVKVDGNFGKGTEGWLVSYKTSKNIGGNPKVTSIMELNADGKGGGFLGGF